MLDAQYSAAQRIDAACDRFEADWRAGKAPRIEGAIDSVDAAESDSLFRALLAVELELRVKNRERVTSAEYKARFPDRVAAVVEVFRAMVEQRKPGSGDTSVVQESIKEEAATLAPRPRQQVIQPGLSQISRFTLVELLGEGAFGQVFRARDPGLDRDVAIKTPRPGVINNEIDRERFLREARALATVQHPNVCPVYEVGESDGRLYTVMAFVSGKTLSEAIKERKTPMPEKQSAFIVRKLALALEAAHAKGVVHRDLKPANIMFDRERKDVVVMDFGLARREAAIENELTLSGMVLGTPAYMAPEQAKGDIKSMGPVSDVYSLGVILYELIAGRRPFSGTAGEVIGLVQHVEPEPPSKWRPDVDAKLQAICLRAMAKDPAKRTASMRELAVELGEWSRNATLTPGPSPAKPGEGSKSSPTPNDAASDESAGLQQIFAVLSDQRKQTVAAVEAAVKKFRPPMWLWLAGAGFAGLIAVLGIIFFAKTPSVMVAIKVDVDLTDKGLRFVLDDKPISAESLANPIELKVGEHELAVFRGEKLEKWIKFSVTGGRNPEFRVQDVKVPEPPQPNSPNDGFTPLFNGKDLSGWNPSDPTCWRVDGGELIGENSRDYARSWIFTDQEYGDYVLRCEYRASDRVNSGIALRVGPDDADPAHVEVDIGEYPGYPTGSVVWGTRPPSGLTKWAAAGPAPSRDWQQLEITVRGANLSVWLNGFGILAKDFATLADQPNALPGLKRSAGRIALQAPGIVGSAVRFRKVEIRPLPAAPIENGFVPLFNGKNLAGWTIDDDSGRWKAEGGDLVATGPEGESGHLFTEKQYADFHLRLEFQVGHNAHSGLLFRCDRGDAKHLSMGIADERAFPGFPTGHLYVAVGLPGQVLPNNRAKLRPIAEWNDLDLVLQGSAYRASINGQPVLATDLKKYVTLPNARPALARTSGLFGIWSSGGQIRFRNIRIKELPPAEAGFVPLFNGKEPNSKRRGAWQSLLTSPHDLVEGKTVSRTQGGNSFAYLYCNSSTR